MRFYRASTSIVLLAVAGYLFNFSLTLREITFADLKKGDFVEARKEGKRNPLEGLRECAREERGTDENQKDDPSGG